MGLIRRLFHHSAAAAARARLAWCLTLLVGMLTARPSAARAHDIPANVLVRMFVKPDGRTLRLLVRVPLDAMRDVKFPERGAYLDLARADVFLRDAARLWVVDGVEVFEGEVHLRSATVVSVHASLASDLAFRSYGDALQSLQSDGLPVTTDVPWKQAMLDVLLEYPITSATSPFSMRPALAHLGVRTTTVLRFLPVGGAERAFEYAGDPGRVALDPRWSQAAWRFVSQGFVHIFSGIDHLLFLLCLVIPLRRFKELALVVTSFTVAHSITLVASAAGYAPGTLWFPPLVEVLIAASIVYMAIENILAPAVHRRWLLAGVFGLIHGFGFSFALRDTLQFAGSHLYTSLAAFNVGVELGQLAALAVAVPVLSWAFRHVAERMGTIVLSAVVAHTAWHWMMERWATLSQYHFTMPAFDTLLLANIMRATAILMVLGAVVHVIRGARHKRARALPASAARPLTSEKTAALLALAVVGGMFGARVLGAQAVAIRPVVSLRVPLERFVLSGALRQDSVRSTMTGVYTAEQATKGKDVFTGICVGCHTSVSQSGPEFAKRWMGKLLWEFYDYVSKAMPESAPATLTEEEYVTVTAYVLKLNGMPPGEQQLTADSLLLRGIRIDTLSSSNAVSINNRVRNTSNSVRNTSNSVRNTSNSVRNTSNSVRNTWSGTTTYAHPPLMTRTHFAGREKP